MNAVSPSSSGADQADRAAVSKAEAIVDFEVVRRFTAGDEDAFIEIMSRHRPRIFSVSLGLLRNHADAEEITQDTFIRAHHGLARFRGDSSLATWLHRIAVNLARNRYWYCFRRHRHDTFSLESPLGNDANSTFAELMPSAAANPAREAVTREFSVLVATCMNALDAGDREILTLCSILNQPYGEIAQALHIKVGTVKSRISRARENLRTKLAGMCPEFAPEAGPSEWLEPARDGGHFAAVRAISAA